MATLNESNTAREGSAPGTSGNMGNLNGMTLAVFVLNRQRRCGKRNTERMLRCSEWYCEDRIEIIFKGRFPSTNRIVPLNTLDPHTLTLI